MALATFFAIIGAALGIWILYNRNIHDLRHEYLILFPCVLGMTLLGYISYFMYLYLFSKDMRENGAVADHLKRLRKYPYYNALSYFINGEYLEAKKLLPKIKNKEMQAQAAAMVLMEDQNTINEAEEYIKRLKTKRAKDFLFAQLASTKRDWARFEMYKNKVGRKGLRYALEADAAYRKGNLDEAKHFGDLAISATKGLQRFIFIKSLDSQKKNPNRDSYF